MIEKIRYKLKEWMKWEIDHDAKKTLFEKFEEKISRGLLKLNLNDCRW